MPCIPKLPVCHTPWLNFQYFDAIYLTSKHKQIKINPEYHRHVKKKIWSAIIIILNYKGWSVLFDAEWGCLQERALGISEFSGDKNAVPAWLRFSFKTFYNFACDSLPGLMHSRGTLTEIDVPIADIYRVTSCSGATLGISFRESFSLSLESSDAPWATGRWTLRSSFLEK